MTEHTHVHDASEAEPVPDPFDLVRLQARIQHEVTASVLREVNAERIGLRDAALDLGDKLGFLDEACDTLATTIDTSFPNPEEMPAFRAIVLRVVALGVVVIEALDEVMAE